MCVHLHASMHNFKQFLEKNYNLYKPFQTVFNKNTCISLFRLSSTSLQLGSSNIIVFCLTLHHRKKNFCYVGDAMPQPMNFAEYQHMSINLLQKHRPRIGCEK
jgi:hypothetical protein